MWTSFMVPKVGSMYHPVGTIHAVFKMPQLPAPVEFLVPANPLWTITLVNVLWDWRETFASTHWITHLKHNLYRTWQRSNQPPSCRPPVQLLFWITHPLLLEIVIYTTWMSLLHRSKYFFKVKKSFIYFKKMVHMYQVIPIFDFFGGRGLQKSHFVNSKYSSIVIQKMSTKIGINADDESIDAEVFW